MLKRTLMSVLVGVVFCVYPVLTTAEETEAFNGTWLKKAVDAFNRVNVTRNGNDEDLARTMILIGYVSGMIAVHRQNNMLAAMIVGAADRRATARPESSSSVIDEVPVRTALAFTPLLAIPDKLTPEQIVAILQKHLDANPGRWDEPAQVLITDALKATFQRK